MRWHLALLFIFAFGWVSPSAFGSDYKHEIWTTTCDQTKGFHDGDTLTCVSNSERGTFVVRFAGLDAPETGQAHWRVARDKLREIAAPGTVAECYKTDQYGRQVCRLRSPRGNDLAETMIREGMAWHAVRFVSEQTPDERALYAHLEGEARATQRGLWAHPDPMPPSECRQLRKKHQKCR
ncbi:thermonuclease family protein [Rhodoferax aquaticus]